MRITEMLAVLVAVGLIAVVHLLGHAESLHAALAARLFYLPVLYAAARGGWRWGLGFGLGTSLVHLIVMGTHQAGDATHSRTYLTEHYIETSILWISGLLVGTLVDLERRRRAERDHVTDLFGRFAAPEVASRLLLNPEAAHLKPERRSITVLFADLRGFTSLSERLGAREVVALLDEFFGVMVDAVVRQRGTVDKFVGDQIMVLFGFPVQDGQEATRALMAADEMHAAYVRLQAQWKDRLGVRLGHLGLGIGINSGEAVVGIVGSELRADFTAIGDTVNVAARLCASAGAGETLVGSRVRDLVSSQDAGAANRFDSPLELQLKGRQRLVRAYRLCSAGPDQTADSGPRARK